jgi:hypothetical protein
MSEPLFLEPLSEDSEPVTATSTGSEDVLGLRISAALVDLAVVFVCGSSSA